MSTKGAAFSFKKSFRISVSLPQVACACQELLTFFCLDTKESKQRKSQGCIHFLTLFRHEKGGTNNDLL